MRRKTIIRAFTLVAGLVLSVAIICSGLFLPADESARDHKAKKEQTHQDGQDNGADYFSAPVVAPPSTVLAGLSAEIYCLFEVMTGSEEKEISEAENSFIPRKLFTTLFRVIISPNAP